MSTRIRQCVIYLLIALLPLQATAATRLALCAEMGATVATESATATEYAPMEHCERMDMPNHAATDTALNEGSKPAAQHVGMNCWLGSTCVAAMLLLALPINHVLAHVEHIVPAHSSIASHYHSVIAEGPQRPPATL
jgi:hypothetical protein